MRIKNNNREVKMINRQQVKLDINELTSIYHLLGELQNDMDLVDNKLMEEIGGWKVRIRKILKSQVDEYWKYTGKKEVK